MIIITLYNFSIAYHDSDSEGDDNSDSDEEDDMPPKYQHNLRKNRKPSYKYKYGMNTAVVDEHDDLVYKPSDQFSSRWIYLSYFNDTYQQQEDLNSLESAMKKLL